MKGAFVTDDAKDAFAAYVARMLAPARERYGLEHVPGEPEAVTIFRPGMISWLAREAHDQDVLDFAQEQAWRYLEDPTSIDPSLASRVLGLAAIDGDQALFDEYRQRFETATVPGDRRRYLFAMGSFEDEALKQQAIDYILTGPLRPQELFTIPFAMGRDRESGDRLYSWMEAHYDAILERIPPPYAIYLPYFASGCSTDRLDRARVFFTEPEHVVPGTIRELAKVEEQVMQCVDLRAREGERVVAYLSEGLAMSEASD